jgi:transcriptional regulator with XRE-family HTH domain
VAAADFDVSGAVRRIRRIADLSQRELAAATGISASAIAHAEAGTRDLHVGHLMRAAAVAGLRVALLDDQGREVEGMRTAAVRDLSGRRFPAHLDTVHSDERWWRYEERYDRRRPTYTFDRDREGRDIIRRLEGTPDDHHLPRPGDSPKQRKAARQRALREQAQEEWRRRLAAGEVAPFEQFACTCPAECDALDDGTRPQHAPGCGCGCDLG